MDQGEFHSELANGRVDFSGVSLKGVKLQGFDATDSLDFSRADFTNASLSNADFSDCVLEGAIFFNASVDGVRFVEANLRETDFRKTQPDFARFNRADLREANFGGAFMEDADFSDCDLSDSKFHDASIIRGRFTRACLRGAMFGACLSESEFVDTDLSVALLEHASHESPSYFDLKTIQASGRSAVGNTKLVGELWTFFEQAGASKQELALFCKSAKSFEFRRARKPTTGGPLAKHSVAWHGDDIKSAAQDLSACLSENPDEAALQTLIARHPVLLAHLLRGGHGRWVLPQVRFGSEFVADFLIAEKDSLGFHWQAVELESPRHLLFTKKGDPRSELTHALRQIRDWRTWIGANRSYAVRPREANGLGLIDIEPELPGLVLMGRRRDQADSDSALRRRMAQESGIRIHTYDWLLDCALSYGGGQLSSDGSWILPPE